MKQHQQQDQQQQQQEQNQGQGGDRRHAPHGDYHGDERRKTDTGGNPGMSTQERKVAQEKRQQEHDHKTD